MKSTIRSAFQAHPFHLVSPSPWPLYTSISLLNLTSCGVLFMHGFKYAGYFLILSLLCLLFTMAFWWRDVITEATYLGDHTLAVQRGINMGIALFIVSEALFFMAIFWAYFHCSLSPVAELGSKWPPLGIETVNPYELPMLNTVILLGSGVSITFAHHSFIKGDRWGALIGIVNTLQLALLFTYLQSVEYNVTSFTISDGIFGSSFFFATGFHGLHVIIGTVFIFSGFCRVLLYQITDHHHLGLESGILYWHFVDIVWIFLFMSIYYAGA